MTDHRKIQKISSWELKFSISHEFTDVSLISKEDSLRFEWGKNTVTQQVTVLNLNINIKRG